jgi:hypothetical protein
MVTICLIGVGHAISGKQLEILSKFLELFPKEFSFEFEKKFPENVTQLFPKIIQLHKEWRHSESLENIRKMTGDIEETIQQNNIQDLANSLASLDLDVEEKESAAKWITDQVPLLYEYLGHLPSIPFLTPPLFYYVQDMSKGIHSDREGIDSGNPNQRSQSDGKDKGKVLFFHQLSCAKANLLEKTEKELPSQRFYFFKKLFWDKLSPNARLYAYGQLMTHLRNLPDIDRLYDMTKLLREYFSQWSRLFTVVEKISPSSHQCKVREYANIFWCSLEAELQKSLGAWEHVHQLMKQRHSLPYSQDMVSLLRDFIKMNSNFSPVESLMIGEFERLWHKGTPFEEVDLTYQKACFRVLTDSDEFANQKEKIPAQPEDYKKAGEVILTFYEGIVENLGSLSTDIQQYKVYKREILKQTDPESNACISIKLSHKSHKAIMCRVPSPKGDKEGEPYLEE